MHMWHLRICSVQKLSMIKSELEFKIQQLSTDKQLQTFSLQAVSGFEPTIFGVGGW